METEKLYLRELLVVEIRTTISLAGPGRPSWWGIYWTVWPRDKLYLFMAAPELSRLNRLFSLACIVLSRLWKECVSEASGTECLLLSEWKRREFKIIPKYFPSRCRATDIQSVCRPCQFNIFNLIDNLVQNIFKLHCIFQYNLMFHCLKILSYLWNRLEQNWKYDFYSSIL